MPKRISIMSHLTLDELEQRYRKATEGSERSHYQIIWLLAQGRPTEEVAAVSGYSRDWIYELVGTYNRIGVAALKDLRRHDRGGATKLDDVDNKPNFGVNCLVTVLASFLAGGTPMVLGAPIPPTPTPSVIENGQEVSIPDPSSQILIISGQDEGEGRETEAQKLPHPLPDICWLRQVGEAGEAGEAEEAGEAGEAGEMAALPATSSTRSLGVAKPSFGAQGEGGDSSVSEQSCPPILQKVSTSAADLVLDELDPPPSPLAVEELTATEPTPQPPPPASEDKEPADTPEQDIKDVENPITDRISIPIVNRTAFGIGPFERVANVTNIQPVLPISLGENYVVVRPSLPFVYVPTITQPQGGNYGLGDLKMQAYFVPKPTGKLTWGIGPTFLFPTASERTLGFGKWGIGPAAVAVWSEGRLVVGGQIQNYWSVAGDRKRANVSQLTVTPFVTYILGDGWYLVSAPVITAFWNIPQGEKWLVPIGGGIGKITKIGDRPFSMSVQAYWHAVRPGNSEGWALVVQLQSLFPR